MAKQLSSKVLQVLDKSSNIVGKWKKDNFNIDKWNDLQDNPIDSPIEQILHIAFETIREINKDPVDEPIKFNGKDIIVGLGLWHQREIGKYRVDFVAGYGHICRGIHEYEEVIIECDSQAFHERSEIERRYEKKRDRFLQKEGYKVFRYTGKEIIEEHYRVAAEIVGYLTHSNPEELLMMLEEFI